MDDVERTVAFNKSIGAVREFFVARACALFLNNLPDMTERLHRLPGRSIRSPMTAFDAGASAAQIRRGYLV